MHSIVITTITIRHELGLDRHVSASSNSLFTGLPSRLLTCGLQSSIVFGIKLFLILVIFRSHFHLYLRIFSTAGSTFNSSILYLFLLPSKTMHPTVLLKNFVSDDNNRFLSFFSGSKFRFHIKEWGQPVHYILLFLKISEPQVV
jgi:hypothetical protein